MPKLGRRFEPQQLQYYYNNTAPTTNAPFGTDHTPWLKSRIVGGKLVPVLERRANPQGGVTPRFFPQVVAPIPEKPNYVDPHMLKEYTRKLHSVNQGNYGLGGQAYRNGYPSPGRQSYEEEFSLPKPTSFGRYRPDSKDLARRYPNLPPIDQNKVKMESSTIFEPEPWTRTYRNQDKENSERTQQPYDSGQRGGGTGVANGYQSPVLYDPPPPARDAYYNEAPRDTKDYYDESPRKTSMAEMQKYELLKMLPRDTFLPEQPLSLSREEEELVQMMIRQEMSGADPSRLKDVYLDITANYDRTLSGWCHYKNLFFALSNAKFSMESDTLRLVASMFVSPSKLQEVNYEKFLSFLGSSSKDSLGNGFYQVQRPADGKGWPLELYSPRTKLAQSNQYYTENAGSPRPWSPRASRPASPHYDSDVGKLLNMTEQQLHQDGIDFERLVSRFQQYDREMRETLSADQIKDVLFTSNVRLQESVVNKILAKCVDNNNDGQYNWVKFVEFLEKVQPAKTGLPIPRSKKPLEYAKKVPSPVSTWPHASTSEQVAEPITPLWRREEHRSDSPLYERKGAYYEQEQDQLRDNRNKIEAMDRELRNLEVGYEVMKKKLNSPREDSPWFKMFMEFANALYKQDTRSSGYLPADEVLNWTNLYNSSYNLEIPEQCITRTLGECSAGGRVNIHNYLTKLGSRDW